MTFCLFSGVGLARSRHMSPLAKTLKGKQKWFFNDSPLFIFVSIYSPDHQ